MSIHLKSNERFKKLGVTELGSGEHVKEIHALKQQFHEINYTFV